MQTGIFRWILFVTAVVSEAAGIIVAVLQAVVISLVALFYNSAGGVLIFLESFMSLPIPFGAIQGSSSLPVFQRLTTNAGVIVLQSVAAASLCSAAVVATMAIRGRGSSRIWLAIGLCCVLAAIAGGRSVMLCVIPASAISIGQLGCQQMRRHR